MKTSSSSGVRFCSAKRQWKLLPGDLTGSRPDPGYIRPMGLLFGLYF